MGRVVLTHSTYIEGLVKWSKNFAKIKGIKTITPGIIGRTKGCENKLKIKITRKIIGGYKLVARKGSTFQEIYIVTPLKEEHLNNLLKQ
tara:strand:- start:235 stop:501 length:267 start_codon:yes stop_codon:yes gene_type:complete